MDELSEKLKTQILGYRDLIKQTDMVDTIKETAQNIVPVGAKKKNPAKRNERKWRAKLY